MTERNVSAFEAQKIIMDNNNKRRMSEELGGMERDNGINRSELQNRDITEDIDRREESSWNRVMPRQGKETRNKTQ